MNECSDLTLMFRVHDEFVIYALEDQDDKCFPYTVEGKWHLQMTKDEELEDLVERAVAEDMEKMTDIEKEDLKADNDLLVEEIEAELDHMTKDQLKYLSDIADGNEDRKEKLKNRAKKRWDTNYVDWDVDSLKKEQGDNWYHVGKRTKHAMTEEQ